MIDCHAHLAAEDFDHDRESVIARAVQTGIDQILVVGEDRRSSCRVLRICRQFQHILKPCIGLHPDRFAEERPAPTAGEIEAVCDLIREHRDQIAAIGEVGLDYWCVKSEVRRTLQRQCLERMAALAAELDLPLNVHARSAGHYTIDLLAAARARRVLMHAFDGKAGYAVKAAADHGWIFSMPPSIVRSPQKQKLASALPLACLALESDSPVLGPDPLERNEPANLHATVDCIAQIKGVPATVVMEETTRNALKLFRLPAFS